MTLLSKVTNSRQFILSTAGAALLLPGMLGESAHAQQQALPEPAPRVIQFDQQPRALVPSRQVELTAGERSARRNQRIRKSPVQQELDRLYQENGMEQPEMVDPGFQAQQPGSSSGTPAQQTGLRQQSISRVSQSPTQQKPNLLDRLFGGFRKNKGPTSPPEDPGMSYKTASQAAAEEKQFNPGNSFIPPPTNAPGFEGETNIAALPPAAPPAAPPAQVQLSENASPLQMPESGTSSVFVPPGPNEKFVVPDLITKSTDQVTAKSAENSELKDLLNTSEEAKLDNKPQLTIVAPLEKSDPNSNLPKIDFNAPLEETVAEAEPVEEPVVAEAAEVDPFANLFLEDGLQPAPAAPTAQESIVMAEPSVEETAVAEGEIEQPYTGMKLEEDLFLNTGLPSDPHPLAEADVQSGLNLNTESEVLNTESTVQNSESDVQNSEPNVKETPAEEMPSQGNVQLASRGTLSTSGQIPALQAPNTPKIKQTKMELIAARAGEDGLKGFCCVQLRDQRSLVDGKEEFTATFKGKKYQLSSEEALVAFLSDPGKYAPASKGNDVIHETLTGEETEGSLDHAVWYKGRLYLFTSEETKETFVAAPSSHATVN